jgi:hypothetical protein
MTHELPCFDRRLLRLAAKLVPAADREEWSRAWQAELWHLHHRRTRTAHLSIGLTLDALWLRTDSWQRTFDGTPTLCLASLLGLCLLSTLIAFALIGTWHSLVTYLAAPLERALFEAPLVVFVAFATESRRYIERGSASKISYWIKRQIFFTLKTSLVLLLAFLVSVDVCQPIHSSLPITADLFQIFFFVIFSLLALRWAFRDQEQRCKQCLHSLATPARVGRPSHNLLEWNGSELTCKQGHGLLSVPEMETSWCQSSQWINLTPTWDQPART